MTQFENDIQKQPEVASDAAMELAQEAVKDAYTKSTPEIAPQASGSPSETSSKVLPGLEIIHGESALEGTEPEQGKNEMYMNSRSGGTSDAFNVLEELKKDPQGDGGGEQKAAISESGSGARKGAGKFEEGTKQSGTGQSAGGEATRPISDMKGIGAKATESPEAPAISPKATAPKAPKLEVKNEMPKNQIW